MKIIDIRDQMPGGKSRRSKSTIKNIVRHHSATTSGDALSFAKYHTEKLGWSTSGYHEVILRDGTVQLCYDPEVITNGVGKHNSYTYHICVVGNGSFTKEQEEAFKVRATENLQRFNLQVNDVKGHKEFDGHRSNICPGIEMDKVRNELSEYQKKGDSKMDEKKQQEVVEYAKEAHKWVVDNQISDGTRPKDTVTREEVWTMLYRMSKLK